MRKSLLVLSGIGLGAGLVYALQQDRRTYRRALTRVSRYTPPRPRGLEHWLGSTWRTLPRQARELLPRSWQRRSSYALPAMLPIRRSNIVIGLAILGSLALGAGLMYLLDAERGRQRRARFQQTGTSLWQRLTTTLRQSGQHLGNKTRGMFFEARRRVQSTETPSDDVLIARVRSQIGHVISHPGAIGVHAHQGQVTLSGPVPRDEVDKLLKTVAGVMGVHKVVNQLEVHDQTDTISGLQGSA